MILNISNGEARGVWICDPVQDEKQSLVRRSVEQSVQHKEKRHPSFYTSSLHSRHHHHHQAIKIANCVIRAHTYTMEVSLYTYITDTTMLWHTLAKKRMRLLANIPSLARLVHREKVVALLAIYAHIVNTGHICEYSFFFCRPRPCVCHLVKRYYQTRRCFNVLPNFCVTPFFWLLRAILS